MADIYAAEQTIEEEGIATLAELADRISFWADHDYFIDSNTYDKMEIRRAPVRPVVKVHLMFWYETLMPVNIHRIVTPAATSICDRWAKSYIVSGQWVFEKWIPAKYDEAHTPYKLLLKYKPALPGTELPNGCMVEENMLRAPISYASGETYKSVVCRSRNSPAIDKYTTRWSTR